MATSQIIDEKATTVCRELVADVTKKPRPRFPATSSATTTPITASVIPTFAPSRKYGSAFLTLTLIKTWRRLARSVARSSNSSGLTDFIPSVVLTTIGKNERKKGEEDLGGKIETQVYN